MTETYERRESAAGGYGGLGAKTPAAARLLVILKKEAISMP